MYVTARVVLPARETVSGATARIVSGAITARVAPGTNTSVPAARSPRGISPARPTRTVQSATGASARKVALKTLSPTRHARGASEKAAATSEGRDRDSFPGAATEMAPLTMSAAMPARSTIGPATALDHDTPPSRDTAVVKEDTDAESASCGMGHKTALLVAYTAGATLLSTRQRRPVEGANTDGGAVATTNRGRSASVARATRCTGTSTGAEAMVRVPAAMAGSDTSPPSDTVRRAAPPLLTGGTVQRRVRTPEPELGKR